MSAHVLVLGGTTEARELAAALAVRPGVRVTTSLAGRVSRPGALPGDVRIGGFGGSEGMAAWLREHDVDAIVDATHPFAATISAHAARAATTTGVHAVLLRRPGWEAGPGDCWHAAATLAEAAALLPDLGRRVFLTTGRLGLAAFAHLDDHEFLVRSVEAPEPPLPRRTRIVLARGPFTTDGEATLMRDHRIDVLVTKDSGGAATAPKLTAARALAVPVVIVRRPPAPDGMAVVPDVATALSHLGLG
ncbi:cobalt-precorrin-6A reductase [Streptomyces himalayensis]|uniref:Cobalt-precorrin-6A reductase n=1 Tax=Streptomyces himalayensis subsp. himalayensis TaxID=2756131 RepID=A0A7W0I841_9ACTN|nr:cobalt-precorrin-6A reductase [Streptomyces himalayensis]MBA2945666.1 cobalt-precorrin-6A reductase [Streptomyces himalayensis subsp. himalayensis]